MAQIIVDAKTKSAILGQVEVPQNSCYLDVKQEQGLVAIGNVFTGKFIIDYTSYGDYKTNAGVPYDTLANLITALRAALFA